MKKVLIINGGQHFAHSGGKFNKTLTGWTRYYFENQLGAEVLITDINDPYTPEEEVKKYVWADLIVYHTPIWWFQLPHKLKEYIDYVFTAGHQNGIYKNDGRSRSKDNPKLHYGTGGLLHGRKYMLTTSWNAPTEAFTVKGEFFEQHNVDEVLIGVHKMNQFAGLSQAESFHFHDMEKEVTPEKIEEYRQEYIKHLENIFPLGARGL
ncbi:modulator of drug activity B [Dysgonomonas hofstadii]|uniref:Modulator of drug activity B n=1 Tax=Dysgonomonas hofstadii TaxID=637886 RepID=A0A840CVI1_9BACT|nr:NAD(P)H-dependent oxidoreductase [Dysgonomonas hofstadii]MBB4036825.1 modulator of drug activity B [Dysgonomonas hofstadii]